MCVALSQVSRTENRLERLEGRLESIDEMLRSLLHAHAAALSGSATQPTLPAAATVTVTATTLEQAPQPERIPNP